MLFYIDKCEPEWKAICLVNPSIDELNQLSLETLEKIYAESKDALRVAYDGSYRRSVKRYADKVFDFTNYLLGYISALEDMGVSTEVMGNKGILKALARSELDKDMASYSGIVSNLVLYKLKTILGIVEERSN